MPTKPKTLFYLLLLIFFLPIVGAWYLFTYHTNWLHQTTNRGMLIRPMLRIENLPLTVENTNRSVNPKQWQGYWVMLYMKNNDCDQSCLTTLFLMNQTRIALGKYQNKVINAYASVQTNAKNYSNTQILRQHTRTILLKTHAQNLQHFFEKTALMNTSLQKGQLSLIDPNGFVMMHYASNINFEDVYHDLDHLLKLGAE